MKTRTFEFRAPQGVRGLPAALILGVGVIVVLGLLALLLFVGAAVAVAALAVSAGVALWHGLRRKLAQSPVRSLFEEPSAPSEGAASSSSQIITEARDIEVEVLPAQHR